MVTSRQILFKIRYVSGKFCRENQVTHFTSNNIFMKVVLSMRQFGKSFVQPDETQIIIQWGACALRAERKWIKKTQTLRIRNTKYLLLFLSNNGYANTLHYYEGVSKSPRTMLITRKSLVVHELPARVCCE